eukprot:COSAG01_NODE_9121_length_2545_cov_2.343418_2_plen_95_part_00
MTARHLAPWVPPYDTLFARGKHTRAFFLHRAGADGQDHGGLVPLLGSLVAHLPLGRTGPVRYANAQQVKSACPGGIVSTWSGNSGAYTTNLSGR